MMTADVMAGMGVPVSFGAMGVHSSTLTNLRPKPSGSTYTDRLADFRRVGASQDVKQPWLSWSCAAELSDPQPHHGQGATAVPSLITAGIGPSVLAALECHRMDGKWLWHECIDPFF
jgi:hypothetical protein